MEIKLCSLTNEYDNLSKEFVMKYQQPYEEYIKYDFRGVHAALMLWINMVCNGTFTYNLEIRIVEEIVYEGNKLKSYSILDS